MSERVCQEAHDWELGSEAAACQTLVEPNWTSHRFHCPGHSQVSLGMWTHSWKDVIHQRNCTGYITRSFREGAGRRNYSKGHINVSLRF